MPKEKHPPAFQFYVDDFATDSAVDAMTNEELGIYIRLLCKAWKEDPVGTVPNDDRILANWGKATASAWKRCKAGVLRAFVAGDDGRLHQKRMEAEWQKTLANRVARSENGTKGSEKRWQTDGKQDGKAIAKPLANGMAKNGTSSSSSTSSSISDDDDDDGAKDFLVLEESARVRERARRIQRRSGLDCRQPQDCSLVAKVAALWDSGDLSDDDVEQALESFGASANRVKNPGAWLHACFANRCKGRPREFNALLAATTVPVGLMLLGQENAR